LQSWAHILTTIAACSAAGAFVDFYIGKDGQRRVKGWLETWWLKFSYVRWDTVGRDESRFAITVMDQLFGRRLFSTKRWIVVAAATIAAAMYIAVGVVIYSYIYTDAPLLSFI
jgi:hypothetical protein